MPKSASSGLTDVVAIARFYDDIRTEVGNKHSYMGEYGTELVTPSGLVDRIAIRIALHAPAGKLPNTLEVKIVLPGVDNDAWHPAAVPEPTPPLPPPFDRQTVQILTNIVFAPLRAGDKIEVWVKADGREIPAGCLAIVKSPSKT